MHSSPISNLNKYIIDPIADNIGRPLEHFYYHDIFTEEDLFTNNDGIDIISHQLEIKFENNSPVFFSWATIKGWMQYNLCISSTSFCVGVERYSKTDNNWKSIIGKKLVGFEIYGYLENTVTTTELDTGRSKLDTYYNEPHLIILKFDNEQSLAIANFCSEKNFVPRLPIGDDVWIIFGMNYINSFIKTLSLDRLDK